MPKKKTKKLPPVPLLETSNITQHVGNYSRLTQTYLVLPSNNSHSLGDLLKRNLFTDPVLDYLEEAMSKAPKLMTEESKEAILGKVKTKDTIDWLEL